MKKTYNIIISTVLMFLMFAGLAASVKNVIGPGLSVNNAVPLWNGTSGYILKDSGIYLTSLVSTNDSRPLWLSGNLLFAGSNTFSGYWYAENASVATAIFTNASLVASSTPPTPTIGSGNLWNSNSALFWVTTTKTNLISDGQ